MVTLKMALEVARTTRNAFNYWLSAKLLSTNFLETTPGVARNLTRENVLEIAYMAALTAIGESPRDAQVTIIGLLNQDRRGEARRFLTKRNDAPYWVESDTISDELLKDLGAPRVFMRGIEGRERGFPSARSVTIIMLGEIRRDVDELFVVAEDKSM